MAPADPGSAFHTDGEVPGFKLGIPGRKLLEHERVLVYFSPRSLKIDMCSLLGGGEGGSLEVLVSRGEEEECQ